MMTVAHVKQAESRWVGWLLRELLNQIPGDQEIGSVTAVIAPRRNAKP